MPTINLDKCIKCQKCVNDCPSDAINIDQGSINDTCIHCGHCVAICPESTIFPNTGEINELQLSAVSSTDFQNLSASIRTCRSFMPKSIDDEVLKTLVENMKHYPSASNTRPIEITVVKSEQLVKRLDKLTAEGLIKMLKFITSPILRAIMGIVAPKLDTAKLKNYQEKFEANQTPNSSQVCHHAPSVLIFHAPVNKFGMASADAYIWATYTSIHANTLGLGTCFNGFIVKAMERNKVMRAEFNIPKNHQVYASLLVGYPKVKYKNEVGREIPKSEII